MKTFTVTPSRHQTPGKFINNHHLIVFHHVIDIPLEQNMCLEGLINMMQGFHLGWLKKIRNLQQFLNSGNPLVAKYNRFSLLLDLIICFLVQPWYNFINQVIFIRTILCRSGNNQGSPGLINQDTIHLIDNGIIQFPLGIIIQLKFHIVTEVVKTKLIIGSIGNITAIGLLTFLIIQPMQNHPDGKS